MEEEIVITVFSTVATDISEYRFLGLFLCPILTPPFTLISSLCIYSAISQTMEYLGTSEDQLVFLALLIACEANTHTEALKSGPPSL